MYVCMHACVYVCMHACMRVCMYVWYVYVCMYACMHACVYVWCICVCMYDVCMYVWCVYVCMYVYVCVHACQYVYTLFRFSWCFIIFCEPDARVTWPREAINLPDPATLRVWFMRRLRYCCKKCITDGTTKINFLLILTNFNCRRQLQMHLLFCTTHVYSL
jgi:hypothetical protein